eukprot:COSAG06_NODE_64317_length_260_cov_0.409938_1_plen_45_part_01
METIVLPRQARDKHKPTLKISGVFPAGSQRNQIQMEEEVARHEDR